MDGTAAAVTAVLGGHINVSFPEFGAVYKYLQAGSLRALAVMNKKRLRLFRMSRPRLKKDFRILRRRPGVGMLLLQKRPKG